MPTTLIWLVIIHNNRYINHYILHTCIPAFWLQGLTADPAATELFVRKRPKKIPLELPVSSKEEKRKNRKFPIFSPVNEYLDSRAHPRAMNMIIKQVGLFAKIL